VNYAQAEQFGGFLVYDAPEIPAVKGNSFYKGFTIMKKVDSRYIYDDPTFDWFTCTIRTDSTLLIGFPPDSYEAHFAADSFAEEVDDATFKMMDEDRNRFANDPSRKKQWYVLKFPMPPDAESGRSFKLSVKEISEIDDELDETIVPYEYFPIENSHKSAASIVTHYVSFTVCRLDKRPGKRGNPGQKKLSQAAQQMFEREYERKARANARALGEGQNAPYPDLPVSLDHAFAMGHTGSG
jgi:hypothetical protein